MCVVHVPRLFNLSERNFR